MPDVIYKPTEEDFRELVENAERLLSAVDLLNEAIDKLGGLTTDAKVTRHCEDARDRIEFKLWSAVMDVKMFMDHVPGLRIFHDDLSERLREEVEKLPPRWR